MSTRVAPSLAFLAVSILAGCTSSSTSAAPAAHGIECACCFTIVEYVRSSERPEPGVQRQLQCEQCCATLTFTTSPTGQLMVAAGSAEPIPCDLCAPAPPR